MIYVRLNELLIEHQKQHGLDKPLSLRELSELTEIQRESLRRFAANKMDRLPVDVIEKVCLYLNCDINELLVIKNEGKSPS
ncbi:helix-turn-helix domain-containing protein [Robertmurraya massiliosenegalensis]|uniref:helix-turn-helix domain-containing protein n=1 Tax=Robertmurraya massiliosenegalensis TaxID=1287657 RepID=UPI0002DA06FB|nr:helix-turn-helix transcriptional regulator [Robertmurraya massiliosenegalensis]